MSRSEKGISSAAPASRSRRCLLGLAISSGFLLWLHLRWTWPSGTLNWCHVVQVNVLFISSGRPWGSAQHFYVCCARTCRCFPALGLVLEEFPELLCLFSLPSLRFPRKRKHLLCWCPPPPAGGARQGTHGSLRGVERYTALSGWFIGNPVAFSAAARTIIRRSQFRL